jgi:methionine biosynthesis protein MetW
MTEQTALRADYNVILKAVPERARVLDVGCGDGALLELLRARRHAVVRGMELSQAGVNACVARGLAVVQGDADLDLKLYPDDAFDVVVLSRTIQATRRPKTVLQELRRIGRRAVVSLPNFAHWRVRLGLLARGRMPMTAQLPVNWHETENQHLCSLLDFADLAVGTGWQVDGVTAVSDGREGATALRATHLANLLAEEAVFVLGRG